MLGARRKRPTSRAAGGCQLSATPPRPGRGRDPRRELRTPAARRRRSPALSARRCPTWRRSPARSPARPATASGRLAPAVVERCFTAAAAPDTSWRLGWDTPSATPGVSHAGDAWPRAHAVGHLGFTGTSLWLDWARGRWAVLLTNRVHPARDRPEAARIKELRREVGDLAWALLERGL
ncbi:MAG: serine hydrolase [Kofleriaceae bacterium]|nr:serine hydrolase [Kofleriaceae bacterium]